MNAINNKTKEDEDLIGVPEEVEIDKNDAAKAFEIRRKKIGMWAEIIEKGYVVPKENIHAIAEEYLTYLNNCKLTNEPPIKIATYLKSKDIEPKPPKLAVN